HRKVSGQKIHGGPLPCPGGSNFAVHQARHRARRFLANGGRIGYKETESQNSPALAAATTAAVLPQRFLQPALPVMPAPIQSAASDAAIMRAVQQGHTERFALLVERYERPLRRVAWSRLGSLELAEDLVQEAFLAAFKSRHTFKPDA